MKMNLRFFPAFLLLPLSLFCLIYLAENESRVSAQSVEKISFAKREEDFRANNIGVAQLEQFDYKQAADSFRRALSIEPKLKIAQINLAIALFNLPDYESATKEA